MQHRLVVNCGLPAANRETWRKVARATPAHSTVTVHAHSSCHFVESAAFHKLLAGIPIVSGPRDVRTARDEQDGAVALRASHDGYLTEYGLVHHRAMYLSADGRALDGEDSFT